MIKLTAIGNLGKDATTNSVNGKNVINFSIAHTEKWKDNNGAEKEKTTWVECAYWNEKTGIVPYLKKGTQVYIEGTPEVRAYQTADGKSGVALNVRVFSVQLLGTAAARGGAEGAQNNNTGGTATSLANNPTANGGGTVDDGDDLPF